MWHVAEAGPRGVATALSILAVTIHWFVNGDDAKLLARWLWNYYFSVMSPHGAPDPQKLRVDTAMTELTEKNFILATCIMQHAIVLGAVGTLHLAQDGLFHFSMCLLAYVAHVVIAKKIVAVSVGYVKIWIRISYVMIILGSCQSRFETGLDGAVLQMLRIVGRTSMVVVYIDTRFHLPAQVCTSAAEVLFCLLAQGCTQQTAALAFGQGFLMITNCTLSAMLETCLRDNYATRFRSEDAEAMIEAFRRMLRGICDGELLLDDALNIQGHSSCLNRLLLTSVDFRDKPFTELLVASEEEHTRFNNFIAASAKAIPKPEASTPPCLRVSLQSKSKGARVGVDLFHVSLSGLYGSDRPHHLLALRQDTEPEPVADAKLQDIPRQLLQALSRRSPVMDARRADSNASDTSVASWLQTLPGLEEMMLLIDASERHLEVRQLHLNYEPASGEGGRRGGLPTLRKFIRPTDWETVRSKVKHYAGKAASGEPIEPRYLRSPVWFRMLDSPSKFMLARTAKLSLHQAVGANASDAPDNTTNTKLWLYLTEFSMPERPTPQVELEGIHEGQPPA